MPEKKGVRKISIIPSIESHETAAWANISETKPVSGVTIPSKDEVRNAKDYVDANEK
jgi:hypothetical protein